MIGRRLSHRHGRPCRTDGVYLRAAADPANTQWQHDLSASRERLGDMAVAAGGLAAAWDHYQAALDIRTTLAADPANIQGQRDLATVRQRIADLGVSITET